MFFRGEIFFFLNKPKLEKKFRIFHFLRFWAHFLAILLSKTFFDNPNMTLKVRNYRFLKKPIFQNFNFKRLDLKKYENQKWNQR